MKKVKVNRNKVCVNRIDNLYTMVVGGRGNSQRIIHLVSRFYLCLLVFQTLIKEPIPFSKRQHAHSVSFIFIPYNKQRCNNAFHINNIE